MPRELAEPAHVNKYQCAAYLLNRITRCTLTPLPAPPPSRKAMRHLGADGTSKCLQLPQSPRKLRPAQLMLYHSCHLCQEGTNMARATPWLLDPRFKAINHPCTFLHHIPDDRAALGKWKQLLPPTIPGSIPQAAWSSHASGDQLSPDDSATHRPTLGFTGKHDSQLQVSLWTHLVYLFECEPQVISALGFSLRLRKLLLKRSEWKYAAITLQGIQLLRQVHSLYIGQDEENEDFKNVGVSEIKVKVSHNFPSPSLSQWMLFGWVGIISLQNMWLG